MAIETHETNPSFSTTLAKEILLAENEIDRHLLEHTIDGRANYLLMASREAVDILIARYQIKNWIVAIGYQSDTCCRLEFEDPFQTGAAQTTPDTETPKRSSSSPAIHFRKSVEILKNSSNT